jgi:DNA-binding response OmpR family regulator
MARVAGERLLVVEDDAGVARGLLYGLRAEGYEVAHAMRGGEALDSVRSFDPALVLLDVGLPDMSGLDVCRALRADGRRMPIILVTARDEEVDKVLGLELGADDYVVKPFSLRELVSRVRALLRRAYGELSEAGARRVGFGRVELDPVRLQARLGDDIVELTPTEFRLAYHLARHPRQPFTRDQLIEAVWGYDGDLGYDRTVDVHVRHLRQKLEDDPANPRHLVTVRGVGYAVEP